MKTYRSIVLRILAILIAGLATHRIERFGPWYFVAIVRTAVLIALWQLGLLDHIGVPLPAVG